MKNFMSIGAVTQSVDLDKAGLSLILGENMDLGGNGSRNGVGKSSLLSAISFGLYGQALTNIRKDNLVNKINQKNMSVTIEFEKDGHNYRIERGRKPQYFKFFVDNKFINENETDEAQGESRETQSEIEKLLGMSHDMFTHVIALNTYTTPFLSLGAAKQRAIIEELLGITVLSQKAENLRELIKATKIAADQEEFRIKTLKQSNERIQNTINEFRNKMTKWEQTHAETIANLEAAIANLGDVDIDAELAAHADLDIIKTLKSSIVQVTKDLQLKTRHATQLTAQLDSNINSYALAQEQKCPTCNQGIDLHDHAQIKQDLEDKIAVLDMAVRTEQEEINNLAQQKQDLEHALAAIPVPNVFYSTLNQALEHKNTINQLQKDLDRELATENPFSDQAATLSSTVQEVDYTVVNSLVKEKEHQEFLLRLLTNKESFIRKSIIDQNLAYLNTRLSDYLTRLGLPHKVLFLSDLNVEISLLGQELDFDNLSRGERTRLILGLSMAFRDIFENIQHAVSLLFIDEVLDNGIDPSGIEAAVEILKRMARERKKNIFVISHREELVNRVENILTVVKENNFSRFDWDWNPTN